MKCFARWIFLIACGWGIAPGAEIFATHFASGPFESGELEKSPVLKSAPTATPFIAEEDELRDVTAILGQRKVVLKDGWAVWNQTRRLLVIQGGMNDQWRVEKVTDFWDQPLQTRVVADLTRSEKVEGTWVDPAGPVASVELIARSTLDAYASINRVDADGDRSLSMDAGLYAGAGGWIDCRFSIDWKGFGGKVDEQGRVTTNPILRDGDPQILASWFAVGHGPASRLTVKTDILLADGTLWREARLRQEGTRSVAMKLRSAADPQTYIFTDFPSQAERKVKMLNFPRGNAVSYFGDPSKENTNADPFAEPPKDEPPPALNLPEAHIPPDLSQDFSSPMFDLHPYFKQCGIPIRNGDFAAYDSISERIFVETDDADVLSLLEQWFSLFCSFQSYTVEVTAWLADTAQPDSPVVKAMIQTRSNARAVLEWNDSKEQPIVSYEVEPGTGGGDVDLRCDWIAPLPGKAPDSSWHSESKLKLESGIPFLTEAAKLPDGTVFQQGFRATVLAR